MEYLSWLLGHLPYPIAITLVIVGLWAWGVKIFTEKPLKTVFQSKLFIFPGLACAYTLVLSMSLISYTNFFLVPVEIDRIIKNKLNPITFQEFTDLRIKVFVTSITLKKHRVTDSRAELYEILNIMEEIKAKDESIPDSFFRRKAELKGNIDQLLVEITQEKGKSLGGIK